MRQMVILKPAIPGFLLVVLFLANCETLLGAAFSPSQPLNRASPSLFHDLLASLRADPATQSTEKLLLEHPFVAKMEQAKLKPMLQAFAREQVFVVQSDTSSLEAAVKIMEDSGTRPTAAEFFRFFLAGEKIAANELEKLLAFCGEDEDPSAVATSRQAAVSKSWSPNQRCQSYPSYFCKLIHHSQPAAVALAFCVNFPAWGEMCGRLRACALSAGTSAPKEDDLTFLAHFASPIPNLHDMAQAVLKENLEQNPTLSYKDVRDAVVLLQHGEVEFWNGLMDQMQN